MTCAAVSVNDFLFLLFIKNLKSAFWSWSLDYNTSHYIRNKGVTHSIFTSHTFLTLLVKQCNDMCDVDRCSSVTSMCVVLWCSGSSRLKAQKRLCIRRWWTWSSRWYKLQALSLHNICNQNSEHILESFCACLITTKP